MVSATDSWQVHCWNGVHASSAKNAGSTIIDAVDLWASQIPNAPFMTTVAPCGDQETLTFLQLKELSMRGATWLSKSIGVGPENVVGLVSKNDLRSVLAIFSILRLGARVAFLDPLAPVNRHTAIADALGMRTVIRSNSDPQGIDAHLFPELCDLPVPDILPQRLDDADDAFYFGTSGSTSTSKIVAQTHRATLSNALAMRQHHSLVHGDRLLGCLPIHHVNGLHLTIMATLVSGSQAILVHGFDPIQYPTLISQFTPRIASVVPSLLQALTITWRDAALPSGFDYFVSAAAPLSSDLARVIWERFRVRVLQGYGLTETTNFSTMLPPNLSGCAYSRQILDPSIPSVGIAVPGNEVAVLTPEGIVAAPGQQGEICVRGHNVMDRYINNAEETAYAFRQGWFHTGDLGFLQDDPQAGAGFLVVTGRNKNIAKVRGESVSLDEMDRWLLMLPEIRDAACVAVPNRMQGESIHAAIVAHEGITDEAILNHLRQIFSETCLPKALIHLVEIPRTPTGKVLRPQLRNLIELCSRRTDL